MGIYSKYLEIFPRASFTAIYLSNQIYGEVDPFFVREHFDELQGSWLFMDYKDRMHAVAFNQSTIRPLLTNGWREMKEVFDFDINQEVEFIYYGNSVFGLMCSKSLECCCQIPMYHSRFVRMGYTAEFYLILTADNVNHPFLNIFGSFEDYVRNFNMKFIIVCCDNGSISTFDIALTDRPFKTTAIGMDWDSFCFANELIVGDVLCFKFTVNDQSNVACVFKVNEWKIL